MHVTRYYALAVTDIENWSARPGPVQARMQSALRQILDRATGSAGIAGIDVRRTSRGDGLIVAFPATAPKEVITSRFVKALNRELRLHHDECPPDEGIRVRLALHAGDVHDGGDEWAGEAVVAACRLVDSDLLRGVLAAADTAVLAMIVSDYWYGAVLRPGWADTTGFSQVAVDLRGYVGDAWVRVPGMSRPPGLPPTDGRAVQPEPPAAPPGPGAAATPGGVQFANYGTHQGDNVAGPKYVGDGAAHR